MTYDALVIGGGPAGCAAAIYAARAGLRVALVERATHPRPKPCGEGLMPAGVEVLRELGLADEIAALGQPFHGVRYVTRARASAEGRFPRAAPGFGVPREELDAALWRAAAAQAGVEAFEGADAATFAGRVTAVCDGGGSKTAAAFGARRVAPRRRRHGLSSRFDGVPEGDGLVEVFLAAGAELYLTPLRGGRATVAVLFEEAAKRSASEAFYDSLIAGCPALRLRLGPASRRAPVRGHGPLGARADRVFGDGWLLAGDAAGGLDPIIGDGVAAALQTGRLAGKALAAAAGGDFEALGRYARERERLLRSRRWLAAGVLAATARPAAGDAAIAALGRGPALFDALLRLF